ncbi:glutamate racemase 2 [Oxobacter pfennigii]|uniref:Glutamate racemase n=1 Tax=Oxobacter pfennigii TaxID=36849 RepID=A0A0P8W2M2_9CLOT|nr:glutamate racemase [Oxobacter pfennigii]KPU42754.1 glutamate racemase 2 [Oxobacter pfennigii]
MKIGVFDSGHGGVTVLREALLMLPQEDYIYFADTLHVPYGEKSKEELKEYIMDAVDFLRNKGIKALIVACNTATSVAIKELRQKYDFPIIGMEPAVKPAIQNGGGKRVMVFATPLTLKEEKFHHLITQVDKNNIVDYLALPELVTFAENLEFSEGAIIPYLREKLSIFDISQYSTVVLGCTHFPLFKDSFEKVFSQATKIIDGSHGTVKRLIDVLEENNIMGGGNGKIEYYSSGGSKEDAHKFSNCLIRATSI